MTIMYVLIMYDIPELTLFDGHATFLSVIVETKSLPRESSCEYTQLVKDESEWI